MKQGLLEEAAFQKIKLYGYNFFILIFSVRKLKVGKDSQIELHNK